MLKKRVIISLLLNDGELYRTKQFVPDYAYTQNFVTVDSIDELFIIDITRGGRSDRFAKYVRKIVDKCFAPICVGGHIRTLEDVKWAMGEFGADSVLINAGAHRNLKFISEISQKIGSQSVTVACDYRYQTGDAIVFSGQGAKSTGYYPEPWCSRVAELGAGQIFLQSIDRDGSLEGYDLKVLQEVVSHRFPIPVVIGGGCGRWQHMQEAFEAGADGCSTSNIYHFPESTMSSWKEALHEAGVQVRC